VVKFDPSDLEQRVDRAVRSAAPRQLDEILPQHSLVLDLGFDSMKVALLSLALEEQFGRAIFLEGWMSAHADPTALTVQSLYHYVREALMGDEESAVQ
jgi:acyl carrier protein